MEIVSPDALICRNDNLLVPPLPPYDSRQSDGATIVQGTGTHTYLRDSVWVVDDEVGDEAWETRRKRETARQDAIGRQSEKRCRGRVTVVRERWDSEPRKGMAGMVARDEKMGKRGPERWDEGIRDC